MMFAPKDCPNCGSFDLHVIDTYKDLTWFECRECGDEWIEEETAVGFDLADEPE